MSTVTLDTSRLDHYQQQLAPATVQAVTETTEAVVATWQATVAVDTGAYQESVKRYGSGLAQGAAAGVDHDFAQEFGRPDLPRYRYRPAARPAAEAQRERHKERVAAAVRKIGGGS